MRDIVIRGLCKQYDGKRVLNGFGAVFPAGRVSCIMSPSGSGKTTLLRILMGLERADGGSIEGIDGLKLSVVFQEDRLLGRLSPIGNIRLTAPGVSRAEAASALDAVGLCGCHDQPVSELSGGMRRRVSLVRALLCEHDLLILDEPFKGLDADTRTLVIRYTLERTAGSTVLLVTHDPSEAEAMRAAQVKRL